MTSSVQNEQELFEFWLAEAQHPFSGWDFSHIIDTGRMRTAPLSWSYTSEVLPRLRRAESMLDMGTGGGEFLSLLQPLPPHTTATEGYAPNLSVARARLNPLGVEVVPIEEDETLPLSDAAFDLVINRQTAYVPAEVFRVLRPGGEFVTHQVGGEDDWDLNMLLGARPSLDRAKWRASKAAEDLQQAGFEVLVTREDFPVKRYFDVGAIVYYLTAVPWQIKDFSVEAYREALLQIHHRIQVEGHLDVRSHRFCLIARKPDGR
ncbi:MAG: class I SAM-dependent methyltransferase [Caldilineales bacterium]|nr:class I SAM-dependent methyltransferase [Caldilineales bacterium]